MTNENVLLCGNENEIFKTNKLQQKKFNQKCEQKTSKNHHQNQKSTKELRITKTSYPLAGVSI